MRRLIHLSMARVRRAKVWVQYNSFGPVIGLGMRKTTTLAHVVAQTDLQIDLHSLLAKARSL